jgi:hypothetical protein
MKSKHINLRKFILVLIVGLVLSGCSKDKKATDNLIGTWTVGTTSFNAMVGTRTLEQYFTEVMGLTATEAQISSAVVNQTIQQSFTGTIQIKSDNTYSATLGGKNDTGTWSLNSDGTQLTINSSSSGAQVFDIVQLTSSVLKVGLTNQISEDLNNDGTPESITVTADVTFNK